MKRKTGEKPLYRKISSGVLYLSHLGRHRVKPKQEIRATAEEIGEPWIEQFELVKEADGSKPKKKGKEVEDGGGDTSKEEISEEYVIEHTAAGWYNVLSPEGKVMNENKLRKDEAAELKQSLEEETDENMNE